MDNLTKTFISGEVLKAQDLNAIKDKVNELVDHANVAPIQIDSTLSETSTNPVENKILAAKIKELEDQISLINSRLIIAEDINTTLSLNSISINNGAASTTELEVSIQLSYTGNPTHYMLSESSTFVGASWVAFTNPASFTLSSSEGSKTVYAKIKDATTESTSKNDSISYSAPVVGTNIVFTDPVFKAKMVQRYDKDADNEVSYTEALLAFNLGSDFHKNTSLVNADELRYFTNSYTSFAGLFAGCSALQSIKYPAGWVIQNNELNGCTSLVNVQLPNDLVSLPDSAFLNCTALENIIIPSTVQTFGINSFEASGLIGITVPNSVTNVGKLGYKCSQMTFADLGTGVTAIGINAFVESAITTIISRATTPPVCGYGAFNGTTPQIYVPDESVAAYKAASWWSNHSAAIHPLSEYQG